MLVSHAGVQTSSRCGIFEQGLIYARSGIALKLHIVREGRTIGGGGKLRKKREYKVSVYDGFPGLCLNSLPVLSFARVSLDRSQPFCLLFIGLNHGLAFLCPPPFRGGAGGE